MTTKKTPPHNKGQYIVPLLNEIIEGLKQGDQTGGLLDISLDNIPVIVSIHGKDFAEKVINDISTKIFNLLNPNDLVIRENQHHIYTIISPCSRHEMKIRVLEIYKIIQNYGCIAASAPIQLMTTIGAVELNNQIESAEDATNKAYIALSEARETGQHYVTYNHTAKHVIQTKNQMVLASYFQQALMNNKLRLGYQPVVDYKTGKTISYECLLRIINNDGTISSAGPFIPIAEKMGFIEVIDNLVVEMAIRELRAYPDINLSINLSNHSISNHNWLKMAIALLDDKAIASRLTIEITETAQQPDIRQATKFVKTAQELGCKIALDDYGAGYTSFPQLKTLPIDIVKIDGSFVRDIVENDRSRSLVQTILNMCKDFGFLTVAEFVENQAIVKTLNTMGVDFMQGNYFLPAVSYEPWKKDEKYPSVTTSLA